MKNGYGVITQYIYWVGVWFLCTAPLTAIYLYTKFYLNATSSFKVICQTIYTVETTYCIYLYGIQV